MPQEDQLGWRCTRGEFVRRGLAGLGAAAALSTLPGGAAGQSTTSATAAGEAGGIKTYDMREFVKWALETFEPSVRLPGGAGHYARRPGETEVELYGTSDMACVLYTLGKLAPDEQQRDEWAEAFQKFQVPDTGLLVEKTRTHDELHNTAFALAAMELLSLKPKNPLKLGDQYASPKAFLNTLNWQRSVYPDSHKGAGIAAIYTLAGLGSPEWFAEYFQTCDSLFDPRNGMMGKEKPPEGDFDQIGGTFHYGFIYEHFNRRMPYPEKRIDAILGLQRPDGHWNETNRTWLTLDAIYMMTRAVRHSHHRVNDVNQAIQRSLDALVKEVYSPEGRARAFAGRLPVHTLTCVTSILAETQQYLGADKIITDWPLRMILDRRPFI